MTAPNLGHGGGDGARALIDGLSATVADLRALAAADSPHMRGAGLAAAHTLLRLAVMPIASADSRRARRDAIHAALSVLARAGFGHVTALAAAALAHDADPASVACGVGRPQ